MHTLAQRILTGPQPRRRQPVDHGDVVLIRPLWSVPRSRYGTPDRHSDTSRVDRRTEKRKHPIPPVHATGCSYYVILMSRCRSTASPPPPFSSSSPRPANPPPTSTSSLSASSLPTRHFSSATP